MSRRKVFTNIATGLIGAVAALFDQTASADINLALPANNPGVQRIGFESFGVQLSAGANDGNTSTIFAYMQNPTIALRQLGYSLNATGFVNSITFMQDADLVRQKLKDVDVYTSNNVFHFTNLPNQQTVTMTLNGAPTSEVLIVPRAYHINSVAADGMIEIAVNVSESAPRTNWALSASSITTGSGYNSGNASGMVDGNLYATTLFKNTTAGAITFDLGQSRPIGGFGIAESVAETRSVFAGVHLEFSNDPTFTTLLGTRDITLYGDLVLQQFDFAKIDARYVRVFDVGRQASAIGTITDNNTGLIEMQILSEVPEPGSFAVIAAGLVGFGFRRRR